VRSEETDRFRRLFTARHALVRARAGLIRSTRSLLRSEGHNLPSCDGDDFARRLAGTWGIPDGYEQSVPPLVEAIDAMTQQVLEVPVQPVRSPWPRRGCASGRHASRRGSLDA